MNPSKLLFSNFSKHLSKIPYIEKIYYFASYLIPISIFFLIIYPLNIPVDMLLMVTRIEIFILIVDLPLLWALQRTHKQSIMFTLMVFAVVFGLALKMLWQNEGDLFLNQATYSTIGGLLPWSDSSGYFADARALLNGGLISSYSAGAGRVLFVSTASTLLGLTAQNLQLSIALICLTCLFSSYFLVREIKASFGLFPAFIGFIILFAFYLTTAGALLSELLGFALGGIGCALLLGAVREKKVYPLWIGIFMLTLAVNARPGAFFIFPLFLLWPLLYKNDRYYNKRFWIGCLIMIGSGFFINWIFTQWLAVTTSGSYSSFSILLLGLVSGGVSPDTILQLHPEFLNIHTNQETTQKVYQMILEIFRNNPAGLFVGIGRSYLDYFGTGGTFSFISMENKWVSLAWDVLYLLGFATALITFKKADKNIWGVLGLGILLSVPIINYVGVRAYAATIPVLAILVSLGAQTILSWLNINPQTDQIPATSLNRDELIFSGVILLIVVLGPIMIRSFARPVELKPVACQGDQAAVNIHWAAGSYIQLVPDYQITTSSVPRVRITDFKKGMLGYDNPPFYDEMKKMTDKYLLVNAFNLNNNSSFWLVLNQNQVPANNNIIGVCVKYRSATPQGIMGVADAISVTVEK